MKPLLLLSTAIFLNFFCDPAVALQNDKPTLHFIVVADTDPGGVGLAKCVKNTIANHETMIKKVKETMEGDLKVNKVVLKDKNWGGKAVFKACSGLNVKPNDAVYFIYNGHGFRTRTMDRSNDKWPALALQTQPNGDRDDLKLSDVYRKLKSKNPRLLIVISESCNSYVDSAYTPDDQRGLFRKSACRKLFVESKGSYMASGSVKGEVTWGPTEGCRFTREFVKNTGKVLTSNQFDQKTSGWNAIFKKTTKPMEIVFRSGMSKMQHPQFEKDPVLQK